MDIFRIIGMVAVLVLTIIMFASQGLWLGTGLLIVAAIVAIMGLVLTATIGRKMEIAGLLYLIYGLILGLIIAVIGVILIILRFVVENPNVVRPYLGL